jgi:hypothetical protein
MKNVVFKFLDNRHGNNLKLSYRGRGRYSSEYQLNDSSGESMLVIFLNEGGAVSMLFMNKTITLTRKWFNITSEDARKYYIEWMVEKTGYKKPSEMYNAAEKQCNARYSKHEND